MKRILFIVFFLPVQLLSQKQAYADSIFDVDSAKKIIEFLASDSLKGRFTLSPEINIARDFIADKFKESGLKPLSGFENLLMPFVLFDKSTHRDTCYNVLGGLQGKELPNETIIFSAHYDHIGTFSTNPAKYWRSNERRKSDSIYNGANDDASGICALILLSKYFASIDTNKRTIIFVAFSGEELGLLGSAAFAENFTNLNPKNVVAVINIEMIGRKSESSNSEPYVTGTEFSNIRLILNKDLEKTGGGNYEKNFFDVDPYEGEKLFSRSDNYTFAKLRIVAHSIMLSSPEDEYYHSVHDEPKTLDYDSMIKVIKAIALATQPIIDGSVTPK